MRCHVPRTVVPMLNSHAVPFLPTQASWHDGTASHPLSEKGEEVPPPPGLPPTGNVAGGTIPRPPSPVNEKLLKEKNALEKKLTNMESKWKQEAIQRKKLFNELQDVKGKIRVMCRSRCAVGEDQGYARCLCSQALVRQASHISGCFLQKRKQKPMAKCMEMLRTTAER